MKRDEIVDIIAGVIVFVVFLGLVTYVATWAVSTIVGYKVSWLAVFVLLIIFKTERN